MKKFFVILILFFSENAIAQKIELHELNTFSSFFIANVLCKETHSNTIIVSRINTTEKLNKQLAVGTTTFWSKMKLYFQSNDMNYLEKIVNSSASLEISNFTDSVKKILLIDSFGKNTQQDFLRIQRENLTATIFEVSNIIFTNDLQFCLVFYHAIHGSGTTLVCKKINGKWSIYDKKVEWIE